MANRRHLSSRPHHHLHRHPLHLLTQTLLLFIRSPRHSLCVCQRALPLDSGIPIPHSCRSHQIRCLVTKLQRDYSDFCFGGFLRRFPLSRFPPRCSLLHHLLPHHSTQSSRGFISKQVLTTLTLVSFVATVVASFDFECPTGSPGALRVCGGW